MTRRSLSINLDVSYPNHRKTRALRKLCGALAGEQFIRLLCYAREFKSDGDLSDLSVDEIEAHAHFNGERGRFVETLVAVGYLDRSDENRLTIHDWEHWQPNAVNSDVLVERARRAAAARWSPKSQRKNVRLNTDELAAFEAALADLNEVTSHKYEDTDTVRRLFKSHFVRGATLEQFKHVHRALSNLWRDTERAIYLRPSTLWGSRFSEYKEYPLTVPQNKRGERSQTNLEIAKKYAQRKSGESGGNDVSARGSLPETTKRRDD